MTSVFFRHEKWTRSCNLDFLQKSPLLMTSLYTLGTRNNKFCFLNCLWKVSLFYDVTILQALLISIFPKKPSLLMTPIITIYFRQEEWRFYIILISPKKSSLLMTSLYILGMRHDTFILFNFIQRSSMLMTSLFFNHEEQQFMLFKFSQKSSFLMTSLYTLGTRKGNLWWINFLPRSPLLMPSLYTLGMRNGAPAGAWSQAASHAGQKPVISWVGLRGIAKTQGGGGGDNLPWFVYSAKLKPKKKKKYRKLK